MTGILTALLVVGGLTLVLCSLLVAANRAFHVVEDPRIDMVEDMLPHTNCGGCGYPGCRPFAQALIAGEVLPGRCTVNPPAAREAIAAFLGVDAGAEERRVARLACAGGSNVARHQAKYQGLSTCAGATLVGGGGKACSWGCLGLGDCEVACDFDAIHMDEHGLPVVAEDKCTACGDCVTACPKDLFSLQPVSQRIWVQCRSLLAGDGILADCEVACTACGRCAMDAPGMITMEGNLPVVHAGGAAARNAIQRCPTGAIVWLEPDGTVTKGPAAHKVIRKGALPDGPT